MASKSPNWKFIIAFAVIVCICLLDGGLVSESTTVSEGKRKVLYLIFLTAVMLTGYLYWRNLQPVWIKRMWLLVYSLVFLVLVAVSILNKRLVEFSTTFLDQVRYFRLFFLSPLPFLLSILLTKMDMTPRETRNSEETNNL